MSLSCSDDFFEWVNSVLGRRQSQNYCPDVQPSHLCQQHELRAGTVEHASPQFANNMSPKGVNPLSPGL